MATGDATPRCRSAPQASATRGASAVFRSLSLLALLAGYVVGASVRGYPSSTQRANGCGRRREHDSVAVVYTVGGAHRHDST
ncbi:MAG: hypothetical protein M3467_05840, partial [Actinomycetota bacterium]|nr:hypothetical protein [Actinomycetota bacterium]